LLITNAIAGTSGEWAESEWMATDAIFRKKTFWLKSFWVGEDLRVVMHAINR
jgi:hypothetical protein